MKSLLAAVLLAAVVIGSQRVMATIQCNSLFDQVYPQKDVPWRDLGLKVCIMQRSWI